MSLKSIKGQEEAVNNISKLIGAAKFPHSLLISGPTGSGKMFASLEIAKALICQVDKKDSCDQCVNCEKINKNIHPDVKIFNKADGKSIKIEMIRNLKEQISLKPYEAKRKVFIIEDINDMTEEASNALLKTLEEPQSASYLILTMKENTFILPTILSRCQKIKFKSLSQDIAVDILSSKGILKKEAIIMYKVANSDLSWILENSDRFMDLRENFFKALKSQSKNVFLSAIGKNKASIDENDLVIYMKTALSVFRDCVMLSSGVNSIVNTDKIDDLNLFARSFAKNELFAAIGKISELINFKKNNLNLKLVWDNFFSQINSFSLRKNVSFV